jgi:hypothetical protein
MDVFYLLLLDLEVYVLWISQGEIFFHMILLIIQKKMVQIHNF